MDDFINLTAGVILKEIFFGAKREKRKSLFLGVRAKKLANRLLYEIVSIFTLRPRPDARVLGERQEEHFLTKVRRVPPAGGILKTRFFLVIYGHLTLSTSTIS